MIIQHRNQNTQTDGRTNIEHLYVQATQDNQTQFYIDLETFNPEADIVHVQSNGLTLFPGEDFTVSGNTITLAEGVPTGRDIGIYIFQNYMTGANGEIIGNFESKLEIIPIQLVAEQDEQTFFPIDVNYNIETDFVKVDSGITSLFPNADYTISEEGITLFEGVPAGRTIGIYIYKNVIFPKGSMKISGDLIEERSIPLNRLAENINIDINLEDINGVLSISKGGTGATTAEEARVNFETNVKTFLSLEQIGITTGEETIDNIMEALPYHSILMFPVTSSHNLAQYPLNEGMCIIHKNYASRTSLVFESAHSGRRWFAEHYTANGTITWTGWKEIFTTKGGTLSDDVAINKGFGHYSKVGNHRDNGATLQIASDDNSKYAFLALRTDGTITFSRNGYGGTTGTFNLFGEHNTDLLATKIQTLLQGGNVSMVRHIQRGTIGFSKDSSEEVTLSGFTDVNKMIVILNGTGSMWGYSNNLTGSIEPHVSGLTTSKLTLTLSGYSTSYCDQRNTWTVSYQVIEFY